jgi:hypothetical protein
MHSFLKDTAQRILADYSALDQVILVLPNRRAGLFIGKHLGNLIDKPHWMPQIKTIEDVFYTYAENKPADQLTLIFELYKIYTGIHPRAETFDRFYYWGEMILKDFNDLDNFLVNAEKLYHQLEEIKTLENDFSYLTENQIKLIQEFWKSFEIKDKAHQEKFLKFWKLLRPLYGKFRAGLSASGLAYSGMLYRQVVEQLDQLTRPDKQYVFIGFNAFSLAEEKLIKHFIKEFGADILWDFDSYYVEDSRQEAGLFFREYRKDKILGPTFPGEIKCHITEKKAKIHVHATPLKINQANLTGKLLENCGPEEPLEETVIILPDEQMLFPILHNLPDSIDKVNVTMGYPVKNAPAYGFLESLLDLQKYVSLKEGQIVFYHKPVRGILASTYFRSINNEFVIRELSTIEETNQVYIPAEKLAAGGDFFKLIFNKVQAGDLFSYLKGVIKTLVNLLDLPELQQNYFYQCYKQLTRLDELFNQQGDISVGHDFFMRLFKQVFREVKLPFEGEPLEGLQVMGVLESRNLDFRRLIICNMNEGSFPPSSTMNSMVPFNLRRAFGLPVQEQNDSIYAYTFYRLLHRAEEVHLIYTTESDEGKAGEKSRYIQQLALESGLELMEKTVFVPVDLQPGNPIIIPKSKKILDILKKYEVSEENEKQERLSPSSINVWLDCRLKFYFQYIAGIREREDVQEKIDPAVFGNLAHYSLEFLYKGFRDRKGIFHLDKEDFSDLRKNWIGPSVEMAIKKHFSLSKEENIQLSGQLIIARDVLQRYIHRLLEVDEAYAPFDIISLEGSKDYFANIPIKLPLGDKLIGLRGIIDRVDRIGETIRLIDYKSGADKKDFTDIPSLFDRDNKSRNKAAMQTMMYGLLYQETSGGKISNPLKPAVFNLKDIFDEDFSPYLMMGFPRKHKEEINCYQEFEEPFLSALEEVLTEIFNPEIPFDQTEEEGKCQHCPFKEICSRS